MSVYIHQRKNWPDFTWDQEYIAPILAQVRHRQGRLLGRMESMGFDLQAQANWHTLTLDVLKTSEIEGEMLDPAQVRSSIARRLGMDIAGLIPADRNVEGIVDVLLDATENYPWPLSTERLFSWHAAMFPTGRSGMHRIVVGTYRDNSQEDPMQVVSGPMNREIVHFQAPDSDVLVQEMEKFLDWFNDEKKLDPVITAAIAHLWFVTIHPFDDGNGRIARAITDMQLSRADKSAQRFYSMSAQIRKERKEYYAVLESTGKGSLDITEWLDWFLGCLDRSLNSTDETIGAVLEKARFWKKHAASPLNDRQRIMLNKLLDGFVGKLTSSKWSQITKTSQDSAGRDINDLVERGIMTKEPGGGRSTSYGLIV
ncbi:MAG TPA: Fic family protein [Puia sp.]